MDVYIDDNGHAKVTEVWKSYLNQGTEGYRAFKLKNEEITNFTVKDDKDVYYEYVQNWDTSLSFSDKAYKCGIHNTNNEVELCWGISEYGSRTYTLNYDINNFVTQYTDTQGIYFNFLDLDQPVGNAKITIHSNYNFSLENSKIWMIGNNGNINFENNSIVLNSNGILSSSQYMIGLIKFENNLFTTKKYSSNSFADVYNSIIRPVSQNKVQERSGNNNYFDYFYLLIVVCFAALIRFLKKNKKINDENEGSCCEYTKEISKIEYYSDIPCNKDLFYAYWLCYEYDIVIKDILEQGIISSVLLKWIKEKKVTIAKTKGNIFVSSKYAIDLSHIDSLDNEIENKLLEILKKAANFDKKLDARNFGKWCKRKNSELNDWFNYILTYEKEKLETAQLIIKIEHENNVAFGIKYKTYEEKNSDILKNESIKLEGLKKFLSDFSKISTNEIKDFQLLCDYMIFAHLLGIEEEVEFQIKKLYPKFMIEENYDLTIINSMVREIAKTGIKKSNDGKFNYFGFFN